MRSGYAHEQHYEWIERNTKQTCSPLGREVANILGYAGGGIYNAPIVPQKVKWSNAAYIEVTWRGELSNWDRFDLTALWVECCRRRIRVCIRGCGPRYMKLLFHQRDEASRDIMQGLPSPADMLKIVDEHYGRQSP